MCMCVCIVLRRYTYTQISEYYKRKFFGRRSFDI